LTFQPLEGLYSTRTMTLDFKKILPLGSAIIVVAVAAYFITNSGNSGSADADNPTQVALGKQLYAESCASCHGANLEGQKNWRQPLAEGGLPAPPHDQSGHTWHHPDKLLFDYTQRGGQAIAPKGFKSNMPGFGENFGGSMSDGDIWAVLAFIKNSWPGNIQSRQARLNKQAAGR
jgi:mono/diheme cytochrome c family protein